MNSTVRKSCLQFSLVAFLLCLCAPAGWAQEKDAEEESVRKMITATIGEVRAVLKDDERSQEKKRDEFQTLIRARLDLDVISKMVMARYWRYFDADQRQTFKDRLEEYLVRWYWHQVEGEDFTTISVVSVEELSDREGDWVVETRITRDRRSETVELRLRKSADSDDQPGKWKIIDMKWGGASRVDTLRGQFEEPADQDGPEGVLDALLKRIPKN